MLRVLPYITEGLGFINRISLQHRRWTEGKLAQPLRVRHNTLVRVRVGGPRQPRPGRGPGRRAGRAAAFPKFGKALRRPTPLPLADTRRAAAWNVTARIGLFFSVQGGSPSRRDASERQWQQPRTAPASRAARASDTVTLAITTTRTN